jgi:ubiquinone biosynthesis monooxygenase Coq7
MFQSNNKVLVSFIRCSSKFSYKNLPKDSQELIDKIIRVDHAGEFGADRIYAGQMAVLNQTAMGPIIKVFNFIILF